MTWSEDGGALAPAGVEKKAKKREGTPEEERGEERERETE
jgi:hypothetical protein